MSRKRFFWPALVALTAFFTVVGVTMAVADQIANNADTIVDTNYEVVSLTVGGASQQIDLYVVPQNGDGKNGCNLTGSTTLVTTAASSNTSVATVTPSAPTQITFTNCEVVNTNLTTAVAVAPVAVGSANIEFTLVSNTTDGTFDLTTARFTVNVSNPTPSNTPPVVSVTGVTGGVSYEFGSVPAAGCSVTDAEDGPQTVAPVIGSITGSNSAYGLGSQEVTCSYTDTGGATTTASATYSIVDTTAPVIAAHLDVTEEATSGAGAIVNYTSPTASDAVDPAVVVSCSPSSGGTFALGNTMVTCNASDFIGNAATPTTFVVHVVDTTAPVIAAHLDVTEEATSSSGAVVTYTAPTTSDAVDGAGTATCAPASGTTFALGNTTVTCSATDAHFNAAISTTFVVHVVDTTPPTIDAHADVTVFATSPSGAVVTYTSPATQDLVDGAGTAICTPASGSLFAIGNTTVTCNATDAHLNAATPTHFVVHVVYNWTGFFQPVDNNGVFNVVKAGQAVPMKFSLSGNMGLGILQAGYPKSEKVDCSSSASLDSIEETVNAGGSSLTYDSTANQYIYVWKTDKAWAGTCRVFHLGLNDGTAHDAFFKFMK